MKRRAIRQRHPPSLKYDYESYVREDMRTSIKWKGSIILSLIAVTFKYPIRSEDKRIHDYDICDFIGNSDVLYQSHVSLSSPDRSQYRYERLYFPPKVYPPPKDNINDINIRGQLRNYIKRAAARGKSFVSARTGKPNEIRFRCKDYHRNRCTFTFVVKWDKWGYFIPLLTSSTQLQNFHGIAVIK